MLIREKKKQVLKIHQTQLNIHVISPKNRTANILSAIGNLEKKTNCVLSSLSLSRRCRRYYSNRLVNRLSQYAARLTRNI